MIISDEDSCAAGDTDGAIYRYTLYNDAMNHDVMAPTQLLANEWMSGEHATLIPHFTSAGGTQVDLWVNVPDIRVTVV